MALLAEKTAEVHAKQEDVLLLLATEDLNTLKARLVQHLRGLGIKTAKIFKVALVAAKEGTVGGQAGLRSSARLHDFRRGGDEEVGEVPEGAGGYQEEQCSFIIFT